MHDFSYSTRSQKAELLDDDQIPAKDIYLNMAELATINTLLLGHVGTWWGVKKLLHRLPKNEPVHIWDIGCGGGDTLSYICTKLNARGFKTIGTGLDTNPHAIKYANATYGNPDCTFVQEWSHKHKVGERPHIMLNALVLHHLYGDQLTDLISELVHRPTAGFVINDLQRSPFGYHSIKLLTRVFSKSYLVKNDAPLSVARGFRRAELKELIKQQMPESMSLQWTPGFRYIASGYGSSNTEKT
jgi:2-polyprenyl-3-methyl-5-hydroxy-6-metoxy-1,4-benzoquinol methylase